MQQDEVNNVKNGVPQMMMPEVPQAHGNQGDSKLETDSNILNCTILNTGLSTDTSLEPDGENYTDYLLALMQCEEPGMNALNWVVGTPAPIHRPISPAQTSTPQRQRITVVATPIQHAMMKSSPHCAGETSNRSFDPVLLDPIEINHSQCCSSYRKPNCSYTCLIGMALQASKNGCLPVNEIYKFIEREYPFFRTAPEGWKNSVRHSLSLNQCFRKVERADGWQGKKGYFWEINPERKGTVEKEIDKWLKEEGRQLVENPNGLDLPFSNAFPVSLQARVPMMPPFLQSPYTPHRSSVTSALGLAGQLQTPQQVAQLQHFAQQLQQECAERMALLQSPVASSPDRSVSHPNKSTEGSTSSDGAGASSSVLFNTDEPPSHYMCSLEHATNSLEDLSSSLFSGFDFSDLDEADSTFHSFILSDDVTFQSDADQVIAMSPAAEVEVSAVSSEGDSTPGIDTKSHDMCSEEQGGRTGVGSSPDVVKLSDSHKTSTPYIGHNLKADSDRTEPCSSWTISALKTKRPCACKRLFASSQQDSGGDRKSELCSHIKLKTSLRKRVAPKRLHPLPHQSGQMPKPWESPAQDIVMGEMAATGDEAMSLRAPGFPMKVTMALNKPEAEDNIQPMHVDKQPHGSGPSVTRYGPMSLPDVFHSPSDPGLYWNECDIVSPTFDGLTEEELKELQKNLFSSDDESVVVDDEEPSKSMEDEGDGEGVLVEGHPERLSRGIVKHECSSIMGPNSSDDDALSLSKDFGCKHATEEDMEGIKKIADELQQGLASCIQVEQQAISEAAHSAV